MRTKETGIRLRSMGNAVACVTEQKFLNDSGSPSLEGDLGCVRQPCIDDSGLAFAQGRAGLHTAALDRRFRIRLRSRRNWVACGSLASTIPDSPSRRRSGLHAASKPRRFLARFRSREITYACVQHPSLDDSGFAFAPGRS